MIYETSDGWVAVAALEPHFKKALYEAMDCTSQDIKELHPLFKARTADEWEVWAKELDLPVVAVKAS